MDLTGPERIGTAEYLRDIEARLEAVQHDHEAVSPRSGEQIGVSLPAETFPGGKALLLKSAAKLSQSHMAARIGWQVAPGGGLHAILLAEIAVDCQPPPKVGKDRRQLIPGRKNGIAFIRGRRKHRPDWPTVLFLHGSGLAGAFWRRQTDDLADRMNTVAIDLPGHGQSDAAALDSVPAYAAAVLAFVHACGFSRPIPCGLSLGGAIALQMLLDAPQALAGGILIGTGARLRVRPKIFDLIADDYPGFAASTGDMAASPRTPAEALTGVEELTAACPPEVTMSDYRACDRFDVMARLPEIRLPVLVICGADDLLTPVKYSRHLTAHIAGARQTIIPRAGHLAPVEQPAAVNEAIRRFITRTIGR